MALEAGMTRISFIFDQLSAVQMRNNLNNSETQFPYTNKTKFF